MRREVRAAIGVLASVYFLMGSAVCVVLKLFRVRPSFIVFKLFI